MLQCGNISNMQPNSSNNSIGLKIALVLLLILSISLAVFSGWAYMGMNDYKTNIDQKVANGSAVIEKKITTAKDAEFVEKEKSPLKQYKGQDVSGGVSIQYPKTWSAYVEESSDSSTTLNGYFHPNFVPGINSKVAFALRIRVLNQPYSTVVKQLESLEKTGKIKTSAFRYAKVPSVLGIRADGEISTGLKGSIILVAVRDKTLEVSTLSESFLADFNNIILPNLSYSP